MCTLTRRHSVVALLRFRRRVEGCFRQRAGQQPQPLHAKAVGLSFASAYACDPKKSATQFCSMNHKSAHYFENMAQATRGSGWCAWHQAECHVDLSSRCDLFIVGFPCAPFSRMRTSKVRSGRSVRSFTCSIVLLCLPPLMSHGSVRRYSGSGIPTSSAPAIVQNMLSQSVRPLHRLPLLGSYSSVGQA